MKRYIFDTQARRSVLATTRWAAFLKADFEYSYFITLTYYGQRKALPEDDVVPFCIRLANFIGAKIYVDGVSWDNNEDKRKHSHIHLVVGSNTELKRPDVKVVWSHGIIDFQHYDLRLDGFKYLITGGNKLPHLPLVWKNNIFTPGLVRKNRFK